MFPTLYHHEISGVILPPATKLGRYIGFTLSVCLSVCCLSVCQKILQNMEKINNRKAARNIKVCDFSILYTKIPPTDPKEKLNEVLTKAFKGGTNQFIRVNKKDAHWDNSRDGQTFSKEQIFLLIDLVIDNSFFRFDKTQVASLMILKFWTMTEYWWKKRKRFIQQS